MKGEPELRERSMEREGLLTRRKLLQGAGCAAALSAMPLARLLASDSAAISPVMAGLSTYISAAGSRPLPDEVIEKAKHHILDTLGAMVSGSQLPPGKAAIQ